MREIGSCNKELSYLKCQQSPSEKHSLVVRLLWYTLLITKTKSMCFSSFPVVASQLEPLQRVPCAF